MLTSAFQNTFKRTDLTEKDIFQYEEMLHVTSVQDVSTQTQFVIETRNHSADSFLYLDDAYLQVKYKITLANGNALAAGSRIGLTHGAWSLFSRVDLELNQSRIDYNDNPGQCYNVLTKASKSYDWIVDNASTEFYYPAGFSNGISTVGTLAADATDTNWLTGAIRSGGSPSIWAKLPLKRVLGFCNTNKVLNGANIILRLEKNQNFNEILMRSNAGDNADGVTVIQEVRLFIPTIKASPKLADQFMTMIKEKPMIVDWFQLFHYRLSGTGTQLDMNLFTGSKRPRHLFLMPKVQAQHGAELDQNGGIGVANSATEIYVTINGTQYPFHKYNGPNNQYMREVNAVKRSFGKDKAGDSSSIVRQDNFAAFNAIFYFDLSHLDDIFAENNLSDVIIKVHYVSAEANPQYFECVLFNEMHTKLEWLSGSLLPSSAN